MDYAKKHNFGILISCHGITVALVYYFSTDIISLTGLIEIRPNVFINNIYKKSS